MTESGFGAEAGAASLGGLLLGGRKILGRGTAAVKGAAKGLGGLTRFVKGLHGRWGLMAGLLAETAYGAYSLFGSHAADAAETPQGAPLPGEEAIERRARREDDAPEDDRLKEPELGFDATETARGAAFHGVEKTVDAVGEHFQARRDAAEHARQRVALERAEHAPGREAADFAAKERTLMGESPATHAAKAVPASPARSAAQAVQLGAEGAEVEAPIAGAVHVNPEASFDNPERSRPDLVRTFSDRWGVRGAREAL
ncbi:hypothetical protein [Lichenibacterium dinghuense]|uniref:hypothetical protein n=1 Tax=Lichenibacterium dinghuense TaxID=2895977 RepID=UPI001F1DB5BC|nr:hypothetical protein [Lichenibacterium sp. 6Y81]